MAFHEHPLWWERYQSVIGACCADVPWLVVHPAAAINAKLLRIVGPRDEEKTDARPGRLTVRVNMHGIVEDVELERSWATGPGEFKGGTRSYVRDSTEARKQNG